MASAIVAKRRLHRKRNRKVTCSKPATRLGDVMMTSVGENEEWLGLGTPKLVCRALREMSFHTPTDIQREAIPVVIQGKKDLVGAAETGSGKTLAFGIPIIHHILQSKEHAAVGGAAPKRVCKTSLSSKSKVINAHCPSSDWDRTSVVDLNCLLVHDMQEKFMKASDNAEEHISPPAKKSRVEPAKKDGIGLVMELDNISDAEFWKMVATSADTASEPQPLDCLPSNEEGGTTEEESDKAEGKLVALILAPTRELALQVQAHLSAVSKYTGIGVCAVVGGMASQKQERLLSKRPEIVVATPGRLWKLMKEEEHPHLCDLQSLHFLVLDEADRMVEYGHFAELSLILERIMGACPHGSIRTMTFSATLTLPKQMKNKGLRHKSVDKEQSLEMLMARAGLGKDAHVIDLTHRKGTAQTLTETRILCSQEDKDVYLYYLLLACRGRTLIFTNSLDCLRRVKSLLEILGFCPFPLHAKMQQRQRLKNLDRFVSSSSGLMVASDVAARGLDIHHVQHVIHYQVPQSTEVYVHRSGRTARMRAEGLSVMITGPEDIPAYRKICRALNRDQDLAVFPVDLSYLKPLRRRVVLASKIERVEHRLRKVSHEKSWVERTAEAMDIIPDSCVMDRVNENSRKVDKCKVEVQEMRAELSGLLSRKITPSDISFSFPSVVALQQHHDTLKGSVQQITRISGRH